MDFTFGAREHFSGPVLKNELEYSRLRLTADGGLTKDELIIGFMEEATPGYDGRLDGLKWNSWVEGATEISTVDESQNELTLNNLPPLMNDMISVPMNFKCSKPGGYIITASDLETFTIPTEIFLEDLVTGGEWHNLVENPIYAFAGSPEDPQARFVVHFFGSFGVEEPGESPMQGISIYSYGRDAYILNDMNEKIKEYVIFDMMGREVQRGSLPNATLNKIPVNHRAANYIVKVITEENVYSEKIFISN